MKKKKSSFSPRFTFFPGKQKSWPVTSVFQKDCLTLDCLCPENCLVCSCAILHSFLGQLLQGTLRTLTHRWYVQEKEIVWGLLPFTASFASYWGKWLSQQLISRLSLPLLSSASKETIILSKHKVQQEWQDCVSGKLWWMDPDCMMIPFYPVAWAGLCAKRWAQVLFSTGLSMFCCATTSFLLSPFSSFLKLCICNFACSAALQICTPFSKFNSHFLADAHVPS